MPPESQQEVYVLCDFDTIRKSVTISVIRSLLFTIFDKYYLQLERFKINGSRENV